MICKGANSSSKVTMQIKILYKVVMIKIEYYQWEGLERYKRIQTQKIEVYSEPAPDV